MEWDVFDNDVRQLANEIAFSKKCTQLKKLDNLRIQQHQPQNNCSKSSNVEFYPRIKTSHIQTSLNQK